MSQPGSFTDHDAPPESYAPATPLAPSRTSERRSSPAEVARTLVAGSATSTLATLSEDGGPWASMVAHAALDDGRPVLMVSQLAEHGRNLQRDRRASLAVVSPATGHDPLDSGRVTLAGRVQPVSDDEAERAHAAYVAVIPPAALFAGFGDFTTWVLHVERVRWVGGYGRMDSVTAADYAAAEPDPVTPNAGPAITHLNDDHADALLAMARNLAGYTDATCARCSGADRYGLDLATVTPRGHAAARVAFDEPLTAASGLRAATVALTRKARGVAAVIALVVGIAAAGGASAPQADAASYKRIVSLTPFQSNVIARLGVRPVAVGSDVGNGIRLHPSLARVPRLTLSHPDGPNMEQLLRLRPNLLLSSPNWKTGTIKFRRQGITVSDAWEPTRVNNVSPGVRRLAKLIGRSSRANAVTTQIDRGIKSASAGIRKHPNVLLVLGVGRSTIAFLPNSWGGDMVTYAGGRLVTRGLKGSFQAGLPGSFAPVSDEEVLRRNPDVIVVVPHGNSTSIKGTIAYFRNKPGWAPTRAVKNRRVYISDPDTLLQASDDPGRVIRMVRRNYLHN